MKTLTLNDYEVTKNGEIINKRNRHKLIPQPNAKGYLRVSIGGELMFVHRLVAEQYVPNPENKPQVNHKDGNKVNNKVENLEWVTNQENRKHACKNGLHLTGEQCNWSKLDWSKVKFIRENKDKYNMVELGRMFGVTRCTIRSVIRGTSWKE